MKDRIHLAERRAVPGLIGLAGPSGSGKTFSALLLAAGMCAPGQRIGLIDTEKGRGSHYASNPTIKANLPEGYDVLDLDEPYSPQRYYEAIEAFYNKENYGVVIIDSATHEWEGFGGCADIAENNKLGGTPNWAMAKKEHKRFMRKSTTMPFTVIFCIRAQEKTAVNKVAGKMVFSDLGMQPVQEKNFKFEMLIACMLDPVTNFPVAGSDFHKVPDDLRDLFLPGRYITKADGVKLGAWISGGKAINTELRVLEGDFRTASNNGIAGLKKYWDSLTKAQMKLLEPIKEECKLIASEADRQANESKEEESPEKREVEKPVIKPNEGKNEKVPEPKKAGTEAPAAAKNIKPAVASGPTEGASKPGPEAEKSVSPESRIVPATAQPPVQAEQKPAPAKAVAEELPLEDELPPAEIDAAHQNAQEIAGALVDDEDEDGDASDASDAETPAADDDEEIELL